MSHPYHYRNGEPIEVGDLATGIDEMGNPVEARVLGLLSATIGRKTGSRPPRVVLAGDIIVRPCLLFYGKPPELPTFKTHPKAEA